MPKTRPGEFPAPRGIVRARPGPAGPSPRKPQEIRAIPRGTPVALRTTERTNPARHPMKNALAAILLLAAFPAAATNTPLAIGTGRVTIAGTSNIHEYTASTTAIQV